MNALTNEALARGRRNRLAAIGVYLVVAVPASAGLWKLLSPARQLELENPGAWLPMRDAVAPSPRVHGSLTFPLKPGAEAALPIAPLSPSSEGAPLPAALATGPFPDAEPLPSITAGPSNSARLAAFNGFLSGSGAGQSGAALATAQGSSGGALLASAGPLTAVSGRGARAAKVLASTVRRAMGVVGTIAGLRGTSRLAGGSGGGYGYASSAAGAPGYSATATPATGGGAASGLAGGPSAGGTSAERSPETSASPLADVPAAGPPADAMPEATGGAAKAKKAAACDALRKAESDSSAFAARLLAVASNSAEELRQTVVKAQVDASDWDKQEQRLVPMIQGVRRMDCKDFYGNDRCGPLWACLDAGLVNVRQLREMLRQDLSALSGAATGLIGAPPSGAQGYSSAASAVGIERSLAVAVRSHQTLVTRWQGQCVGDIPPDVRPKPCLDANTCKVRFTKGDAIKRAVSKLVAEDQKIQRQVLDRLDPGWCERYGCASIDAAGLRRDLDKHNDAVHVWEQEAPAGPLAKTADAASHLAKAEPLLAAPAGDVSRNLIFGSLEARNSYGALSDAAAEWRSLRDEACSQTK